MHVQGRPELSRRVTHDNRLRNAGKAVIFAHGGGVEQVVRGLLERRQHEYAVLHLRNTEARDTQDLALHNVGHLDGNWEDNARRTFDVMQSPSNMMCRASTVKPCSLIV